MLVQPLELHAPLHKELDTIYCITIVPKNVYDPDLVDMIKLSYNLLSYTFIWFKYLILSTPIVIGCHKQKMECILRIYLINIKFKQVCMLTQL